MNNDRIVDVTTNINLYTQLAVALVDIYALTLSVPNEHELLKDILALETVVQVVEFAWYFFVIQHLPQEEMAKNRYYDWLITTPLMLVSIFSYLLYEEQMETNSVTPIRLSTIIEMHWDAITQLILSNFAMLSIGYLYEIGEISKSVAFVYGFVFLINTFSIIYMRAGNRSTKGNVVFVIMFLLWSIYGVAFILPTPIKNSIFNITDLFSKNFFELYIASLTYQQRA